LTTLSLAALEHIGKKTKVRRATRRNTAQGLEKWWGWVVSCATAISSYSPGYSPGYSLWPSLFSLLRVPAG